MNNLERIYDLLHERNMMSSNEEQVEYWDVMDAFSDDLEKGVEMMQKEVDELRKNRQYFRLTHSDMRAYENTTIDDVYVRYLPSLESGAMEQDIQIVIGDRTMYIPLNAETYNVMIDAMKECYRVENK